MYLSSFDDITFFVHQQVEEIKKQGHEVRVISPIPYVPPFFKYLSKKWKKFSKNPKKMIWDQIEVYYPRYLIFPKACFFSSSGKRMYWGIKKIVAEIHKSFKFDIIHSHTALPDGYAGMFLAKKYKKPLIVTTHGQDFQQTIYKNKKCKKNIERVINFSKKTIVVSNKLKKIGEKELKIKPQKFAVIPNGINIKDIYLNKSILNKKYKNKKIILSVSNLIKIKGIDYNLRAIAKVKEKHPKIIYLIIGDGPERNFLENLAKQLNIENLVKFLGLLPHKKTMEYFSVCDIFSLPSWNEGFGVVYLEAMASGKPIIACMDQGIDDIIENKKNGLLVNPKSEYNLFQKMDFLLSNPFWTKKIGKQAKKTVEKNYTWNHVVKNIIEVYQETLK
jgi:hypothetical protein